MKYDIAQVLPVLARVSRILERTPAVLPLPQYRLLALVAAGEDRASRLAARLPVARPTVTSTVDGLVAAGLLSRQQDRHDGRVTRLSITPVGREQLDLTNSALAERLGSAFAAVSDPAALIRLLLELDEAIEASHRPAVSSARAARR